MRQGCIGNGTRYLEGWFGRDGGLTYAYDFYVHKVGKWPWKLLLWKSYILPKHWFVLCLFAHGKLLTRDRQYYISDKTCVLCKRDEESSHHLFFSCSISNRIWQGIRDWLGMKKNMATNTSILKIFSWSLQRFFQRG